MPSAHPHKPAHARGVGGAGSKQTRGARRWVWSVGAVVVVVGLATSLGIVLHARTGHATVRTPPRSTTTTSTTTTTTTPPPTTIQLGPAATGPSAPPCTPVAVAGGVYAVGDSVMLDAQEPLQTCVPAMQVNAAVSRQWSDGEALLSQVMAGPSPPSVVVVALGTNGPITDADFNAMMAILQRASRVVFVTVHVDRPWQDQVNSVLTSGVARFPKAALADWAALAAQNPQWFYSDGTHLPIDGPGAQALGALIASKV